VFPDKPDGFWAKIQTYREKEREPVSAYVTAVQSGFYEVALTTRAPGPFSYATSQNPQDLILMIQRIYRE
jgi:hypothetical protein